MGCSPPGSTVCGIFQARMLEWVAMPSSRWGDNTRLPGSTENSINGSYLTNHYCLLLLIWHIQGPFVLLPPLPPGPHSLPHCMFPAILTFSLFLGGISLPSSSEPLQVLFPLPGTGLSPNVHTSFPVSLSSDLAFGRRPALTTWSPLVFPRTPHALLPACSFLQSTSYLLTE